MITSTANDKIKLVHALQTQRRAREKERLFVIEGVRLAEEAIHARAAARLVLHTDSLDPRGLYLLILVKNLQEADALRPVLRM